MTLEMQQGTAAHVPDLGLLPGLDAHAALTVPEALHVVEVALGVNLRPLVPEPAILLEEPFVIPSIAHGASGWRSPRFLTNRTQHARIREGFNPHHLFM